jgi:hypothetical protein
VVNNILKDSIFYFKLISDRIYILHIKSKFFNISLMNAYASIKDMDDFLTVEFYQGLEQYMT